LYSEGYSYNTANGNLLTKNGLIYTYDSNHKHAVATLSNGNMYSYDANGNMTQRHVNESGFKDYTLSYDAENHLTNVTGSATAQFTYNGDGQRVKSVENGTTKVYIGNYLEWNASTSTMKKYYYAGSTRVAMREGNVEPLFLLGDHLGSTNKVAFYNGTFRGEQRYKAWGETRFVSGDIPTDFHFTGQREDSYIKLYDYGARWYDPYLSRWAQPDSIIADPFNSLDFDRYQYVRSNPLKYTDTTGHNRDCAVGENCNTSQYYVALIAVLKVQYEPINQFNINPTDDSWDVSCGIVAGHAAGASLDTLMAAANKHGYDINYGIQPSGLVATYKEVYGDENVEAHNEKNPRAGLLHMYQALKAGKVVIVDILVHPDGRGGYLPGPGYFSIAHFAVVLEINLEAGTITLANSLGGDPWVLTFDEFYKVWYNPEQQAKEKPDKPEKYDYWWIAIIPRSN
jgi:RHS repeat-associated protein